MGKRPDDEYDYKNALRIINDDLEDDERELLFKQGTIFESEKNVPWAIDILSAGMDAKKKKTVMKYLYEDCPDEADMIPSTNKAKL